MDTQTINSAAPIDVGPAEILKSSASPMTLDLVRPKSSAGAVRRWRISRSEIRRRLCHILPGLTPFILWFVPHQDPISPTLRGIFVVAIAAIAAKVYSQFGKIRRTGERDFGSAVLGYSVSVLGMLFLFPYQAELGLALLAILAFGDGLATLGGLLVRGPRLPWNPQKSWAGTTCFVLFGLPMTALIYWGETHNLEAIDPGVSPLFAMAFVAPAVVASAIAESVRSTLNDNVRIGVTAAACLAAAQIVSQQL